MNALLLFALLTADPPSAPPPPPPAANDCFPSCRLGFFCSAGQCVSVCNPPCAAGESCTPAGQCIAATGATPVAPLEPRGPVINSEGEHAPHGYHWEMKRTRSLITAGAVTAGVAYLISVISGVAAYDFANIFSSTARDEPLYLIYLVPLAGPLVGRAMLSSTYGPRLSQAIDWLWAAVLSVCQVGGLTMLVLGTRETEQLVSDDPRASRTSNAVPIRWSLAPFAPGSLVGLTFTLRH